MESCPKQLTTLRWLLRRGSPLPIPNRVVKPACADGTAVMWESMSSPFFSEAQPGKGWASFFIGSTCSAFSLGSSPLSASRQVCFASSAKVSGLLKNPVLTKGVFVYRGIVFLAFLLSVSLKTRIFLKVSFIRNCFFFLIKFLLL